MKRWSLWPLVTMSVLCLGQNATMLLLPGWAPQLVYLGVLYYALTYGAGFGLALGLFAGLYFEMFGVGTFGCSSLLLGASGFLAGRTASKIFKDSFLIQFFLPIALFYAFECAQMLLFFLENGHPVEFGVFWSAPLLRETALLGIEAPLVFALLKKHSSKDRRVATAWP